jgi:hypothetical protein
MQFSEIVKVIEIDDNDSVRPDLVPASIKTIGDLLDAGKLFDSKDVSYPVHFVALAANGACAVVRFAAGADRVCRGTGWVAGSNPDAVGRPRRRAYRPANRASQRIVSWRGRYSRYGSM